MKNDFAASYSRISQQASILAMIGGCFMTVAGLLILGLAIFVIPHLDPSMFASGNTPVPIQNMPSFVASILAGIGLFGLISGLVVLGSGVMLRIYPNQSVVYGLLMLVFSVLSFLGTGGFVVGAILGIIGGIMTLRWKQPGALAQTPSMSEKTSENR
jgi:hypothetical protein